MRLIAVIGIGLVLAGCGDSGSTKPGDDANPSGDQPSASRAGGDDAGSEANGSGESEAPQEASGPVLPPLPGSEAADPQGSVQAPAGNGQAQGQIRVMNWQEALDLVQQQRGKVVVLDIWSHSCLPCMRELPHFVALSKSHPEHVVCIGFNVDYTGLKSEPPESFRDDVHATLAKYDARFVNVICSQPSIEFFDSIELGGPPAVYVFDQQGQQVKRFDNDNSEVEFTYEKDVAPLVEELLDSTRRESGIR